MVYLAYRLQEVKTDTQGFLFLISCYIAHAPTASPLPAPVCPQELTEWSLTLEEHRLCSKCGVEGLKGVFDSLCWSNTHVNQTILSTGATCQVISSSPDYGELP